MYIEALKQEMVIASQEQAVYLHNLKPRAYSGGIRTGVPIQFGHPFRLNPDSDSDSKRTGVPILFGQ
jgi:hypothetical protein